MLARVGKTCQPEVYRRAMRRKSAYCVDCSIIPCVILMSNCPGTTPADLKSDHDFAEVVVRSCNRREPGFLFDGSFPYLLRWGRDHFVRRHDLAKMGMTFFEAFPGHYFEFHVPPVRYHVWDALSSLSYAAAKERLSRLHGASRFTAVTAPALRRVLHMNNLALLRDDKQEPLDLYTDEERNVIDLASIGSDLRCLAERCPEKQLDDVMSWFRSAEARNPAPFELASGTNA